MISASIIPASTSALKIALATAGLPIDDIDDPGRTFFALDENGRPIGFGGIETYGGDVLLRSFVVLPELRGKGHGGFLLEGVLARARETGARQAWLFTDSAEPFFTHHGFARVARSYAPPAILSTRQASFICGSAPLMTRTIQRHG